MSRTVVFDRPKLVLFDAGGVLVTPPLEEHHSLVKNRLSLEDVRRILYATYTDTTMPVEGQLVGFWETFAQRLGLDDNPFQGLDPQLGNSLVRWNRPADGAIETLAAIKDRGIPVAVVSNAGGDVDRLLDEAGVCHVREGGQGVKIDYIFDSGDTTRYPDERLSRKPNATMFEDAFDYFKVSPSEALFVGDALWSDGLAAQRTGVPFLHVDPFGDCKDTVFRDHGVTLNRQGHDHVTSMYDVLPFALGERPRSIVHGIPHDAADLPRSGNSYLLSQRQFKEPLP